MHVCPSLTKEESRAYAYGTSTSNAGLGAGWEVLRYVPNQLQQRLLDLLKSVEIAHVKKKSHARSQRLRALLAPSQWKVVQIMTNEDLAPYLTLPLKT
ncbi:hypothetical protein VNO77_03647 [Canavalia gladiata]|uniref:Uncharacterized protein n=1 Tax=Canavalia gladiata TaxID=3824 RepID=A0AAN9R710_CANGL